MYFNNEGDKPHWGWSWLERWMAARPWENRPLKDTQDESPSKVDSDHHDNRSLHSYRDDSPTQSQTAAATASHKTHSENTSNKHTSPITSTLIQLQRQQRQMLRGCTDPVESDTSSPNSNSESTAQLSTTRSYMAATKSAQAKVRPQSTSKQRASDDESKPKKRSSLPVRDSSRACVSPNTSQTTSRNSSRSGDGGTQTSSHKPRESSYKPSSTTRRSQAGNFMSASYNMDRGSRKTSDILTSAYRSKGPGDFRHQSYNLSRPSSRNHDVDFTSYDRPRRSTANLESSTKKDDFLAQFSAKNSRNKKDILSQSLNYERPSTQKKPSSNYTDVGSQRYSSSAQPRTSSRRSGEYTRHDRPNSSDLMQRSYQSDHRPPLGQSADFTSARGGFRKPLR